MFFNEKKSSELEDFLVSKFCVHMVMATLWTGKTVRLPLPSLLTKQRLDFARKRSIYAFSSASNFGKLCGKYAKNCEPSPIRLGSVKIMYTCRLRNLCLTVALINNGQLCRHNAANVEKSLILLKIMKAEFKQLSQTARYR